MMRFLKTFTALTAVSLLPALTAASAEAQSYASKVITQPSAPSDVAPYMNNPSNDPVLSRLQMRALLRNKIKYVFVIFNENHSFDNEFGTFPGANGLYSDGQNPRSAANTPGFTQSYTDANGATVTVSPFKIGPAQNASVVDSVDHSHTGLAKKINVVNGVAKMDQFAADEYAKYAAAGGTANQAKGAQFARLVMSNIDCNTIPFMWKWASRFTLFDNIFATEDTPSTPNAIAMLAGQAGETQWVKHGSTTSLAAVGTHTAQTPKQPVVDDPQPFYGSQYDTTTTGKTPAGAKEFYGDTNIAGNQTYASLPLTFMGNNITATLAGNRNPSVDLPDVQKDIPYIQNLKLNPVAWRWYQEGYTLEPTDTNGVASHNSYVSHHNGAQYFGYIANTPAVAANMKGLNDFFTDISAGNLPNSGVFYIRGGFTNIMGLTPPNTAGLSASVMAAITAAKSGDDDHPGYSDRQISEALMAKTINAITSNPAIWAQSAIIVTYDESDGFYDHVPPRILSYGPDSLPLSRGVRVPLILISPYARSHATSRVEGDHNAVIQTINDIFGLPPLSSLPDEAAALAAGNSADFNKFGPTGFQQQYLGPRDTNSAISDSLLSGFDPLRLMGKSAPIPASFASIPDATVTALPHYGTANACSNIGITPEDQRQGLTNNIPTGFNPLPSTNAAAN